MMTTLVAWLTCLMLIGFAVALIIPVARFSYGMLHRLFEWAAG